jgi:hypothetical protein
MTTSTLENMVLRHEYDHHPRRLPDQVQLLISINPALFKRQKQEGSRFEASPYKKSARPHLNQNSRCSGLCMQPQQEQQAGLNSKLAPGNLK